jgi:hypothetical protein
MTLANLSPGRNMAIREKRHPIPSLASISAESSIG